MQLLPLLTSQNTLASSGLSYLALFKHSIVHLVPGYLKIALKNRKTPQRAESSRLAQKTEGIYTSSVRDPQNQKR
jgi:hypothetical protein